MSVMTLSAIEQIAQDIEDWGDGWRFMWGPDYGGRRARLCRNHDDDGDIRIEIEIVQQGAVHFVYVLTTVRGRDGGWTNVSSSVHNPTTRKALDHINRALDELAGGARGTVGEGEGNG